MTSEERETLKRLINERARKLQGLDNNIEWWHGTENGYEYRKCRCDLCRSIGTYKRNQRRNKQRESDSEYLTKQRTWRSKWVQRNPERQKENTRKWTEENRESVNERHRLWQLANRDKTREYNRKYRKKKREQSRSERTLAGELRA